MNTPGGQSLSARQMESLALYFRTRGEGAETVVGADPGALDHHLSVAENFPKWALDSDNRGGARTLTLEELSAQRAHLEEVFRSLRTGTKPCQRIQPLSEQEVASLRRVLTPKAESGGDWVFPKGVFCRHAQLRNWLMVETALELGLRRGELLKLRLDSLPRGGDDGLRVLRRPDDPHDSRQREPAVKTAERVVPVSRSLLSLFRAYLISAPPLGRVTGKTPYLFVTGGGAPLSVKAPAVMGAIRSRSTGTGCGRYGVGVLSTRGRSIWLDSISLTDCAGKSPRPFTTTSQHSSISKTGFGTKLVSAGLTGPT